LLSTDPRVTAPCPCNAQSRTPFPRRGDKVWAA
jgi:hypothetical protein